MRQKISEKKITKLAVPLFMVAAIVLALASTSVDPQATMDAAYYHIMTDQLKQGRGFVEPIIWHHLNDYSELTHPMDYWMPLGIVAYYLARIFSLNNGEIWINIFLWSVLATLIFFEVKKRCRSHKFAFLSYLTFVFSGRSFFYVLTTDNIAIYAFLGYLFISEITKEEASPGWSGFYAGLLALTRIEGVIFAALGLVWLLFKQKNKKSVFYLIVFLLTLSPWFVRNYRVLGAIWPSNSSALLIQKYQDIFDENYKASLDSFLEPGIAKIIKQRAHGLWDSFLNLLVIPAQFILLPLWLAGIIFTWRKDGSFVSFLWVVFWLLCGLIFTHQAIKGTSMHISSFFQPHLIMLTGIGLWQVEGLKKYKPGFILFIAIVSVLWALFFSIYSKNELTSQYQKDNKPYRELFAKLSLPSESRILSVYPIYVYMLTGLQGSIAAFDSAQNTMILADKLGCTHILIDKRANDSVLEEYNQNWLVTASHSALILLKKQNFNKQY
jgi:hypothetical protein